ncbi:MAG: PIG-L family deacetylase [Calditrichaceae bacterium]|nr:PIG-L family deacetylase [Calditrichaceae bacterium]MBN2708452.1 PIG-L family deacetylase [Calditrichaceae bacterium]RQV93066.1 MAG: PIG-L family deacetylase [Calditrichota bacterium]
MKNKTILCFAAHPDDLEYSCTATLHLLIKEGYEVIYIIITNGENGFKMGSLPPKERVAIRRREQIEAAEMLGVKETLFLDYKDGFLDYTEELRARLTGFIKKYKPEFVFVFDPANGEFDSLNLFHRDHRNMALAVFDACFAAKNLWMYPGEPHRIKTLYFYGTRKPNCFVDITEHIELKLKLLACHKSQFPDFTKIEQYIREDICAVHPEYKYSEAFRKLDIVQKI